MLFNINYLNYLSTARRIGFIYLYSPLVTYFTLLPLDLERSTMSLLPLFVPEIFTPTKMYGFFVHFNFRFRSYLLRSTVYRFNLVMSCFYIGIEVELLLQALTFEEDHEITTLKHFAYAIAASYRENAPSWVAGMREEIEIDSVNDEDKEGRYTEWVLTSDKSIQPAPYNPHISPRQCISPFPITFILTLRKDFRMLMETLGPLELVSPILDFSQDSVFRREVQYVLNHLKRNSKINVNQSCGNHVHLSPKDNNRIWTLQAVKAICRSIVYFEFAFEVPLPPHRRKILGLRVMCSTMTNSLTKVSEHASISLVAVKLYPELLS